MKIILAGLTNIINYGDQFIAYSVEHLVKKSFPSVNIEMLDFEGFIPSVKDKILIKATGVWIKLKSTKLVYATFKQRCYHRFAQQIENADGIIFICGSFKYGTQYLWAYYSIIIEIAQKYNVPVMFDAMNVQNYNSKNLKCMILKKHLNYPCVKMFTTRDGEAGVVKLNNYYKTNDSLKIYPVGDPAYWIKECYGIDRNCLNDVIGINLIRGNIFLDYGGKITEDRLLQIYSDFIRKLDDGGYKWELFTNGMHEDFDFGKKLLKKIEKEDVTIREPQSAKELVNIISSYSRILGARLHACICAYSLNIPIVGFFWDEKLVHFSEMANIEKYFVKEQELSGLVLYQKMIDTQKLEYNQ